MDEDVTEAGADRGDEEEVDDPVCALLNENQLSLIVFQDFD